jgi:hypothetical protein
MMFEPYSPFALMTKGLVVETIKTNVRGILDSYHSDFDFLIELLQNALDALEERFGGDEPQPEAPRVEILINYQTQRVRVSDNGIGMDEGLARNILSPSFTTKPYYGSQTKRSLRGHKGVGLTFLAFSGDSFRFATKQDGVTTLSAEMNGGQSWAKDQDNQLSEPTVQPTQFRPEFLEGFSCGSSFELRVENLDRLSINWAGWHQILTTATAVGFCDINGLHSWSQRAKARLIVISKIGSRVEPPTNHTEEFPLGFQYPDQMLNSLNLDDFYQKRPGRIAIPESEKNRYEALFVKWDTDKIEGMVFDNGNIDQDTERYKHYIFTKNHLPSIYALFTHSQRVWRDRLDTELSPDRRRRFWRPGVQVVTNQMPTGQLMEISLPYRAGNKDRIFMLLELEGVKPDYGRKGFHSDVVAYLNHLAAAVIGYFLDSRQLLRPTSVAHGPTTTDAEATADARISTAQSLKDLGLPGFIFMKEPQYENDVISLFMELATRGFIRGFEILSSSSGSQYDAVVNYKFTRDSAALVYEPQKNPLGVAKSNLAKQDLRGKNLEFKRSLDSLISDFEEEQKSPSQVRFVVAWDEGDIRASGYELVDLTTPGGYGQREFHGQTHRLVLDATTIPVFLLRSVVASVKQAAD